MARCCTHRVGSDLCFWLLLDSGNDDVKEDIESFDRSVNERLSDQNFMADPADGFYIQDEPDEVPNGIARTEDDYGDMIIPDTLDADNINDT